MRDPVETSLNTKPTVFLVDDDPTVRDALGLFLESSELSVKTYPSAQAFLDDYRPACPGCLVLDIRMPGMSGMELQQCLLNSNIAIPIIFLTGHGDIPMSVKALKAGAIDFLEKPFNADVLLARIREALENDAQTRELNAYKARILACYEQLTRREREVMNFVIAGSSNKEIAKALDISHRTIDVHRSRIMAKMEANSLPDLVNMATLCNLA